MGPQLSPFVAYLLTVRYVLPARNSTLREISDFLATSTTEASSLLPQLESGLVITIALHGPSCMNVSIGDTALSAGNFRLFTSQSGPASSQLFTHTFTCVDCDFGSLSQLPLTFHGTCQSVALAIGTVGAQGAVSLSFRHISFENLVTNGVISGSQVESMSFLTSVEVTASPAVEAIANKIDATERRGLLLAAPSITGAQLTSSLPEALAITILLPASSTFSGITIVPKFVLVDLIYMLLSCFSFGESPSYARFPEASPPCRPSRAAGVFFTFTASAVGERCNRLEIISSPPLLGPSHMHARVGEAEETQIFPETPSADNRVQDAPPASGAPIFRGLTMHDIAVLVAPGVSVETLIHRSRMRQQLSSGSSGNVSKA